MWRRSKRNQAANRTAPKTGRTGLLHRHQRLHTGFRQLFSFTFLTCFQSLSNGCKGVFFVFFLSISLFFLNAANLFFIEKLYCFAPNAEWTTHPAYELNVYFRGCISVRQHFLLKLTAVQMSIKAVLSPSFSETFFTISSAVGLSNVTMVHFHQPSFCPPTLLSSLKCLTYSHVHSSIHSLLSCSSERAQKTNLIVTRVYLNIHYAREKDNTHTHTLSLFC